MRNIEHKSFNVNPSSTRTRLLVFWLTLAAIACAVAVPIGWNSLCAGWNDMRSLLRALGVRLPAAIKLAAQTGNPLTDFGALISGSTKAQFMIVCVAVIAICLAVALITSAMARRNLHDGTWIGGKRTANSQHGDARIISRPSEVSRYVNVWSRPLKPAGGDVVVGSVGDALATLSVTGATGVLGQSGDGKSRRVSAATIVLNVLQGHSLVVNDISGELERWTRPFIESLGKHRILSLRLGNPQCSDMIDPLARAKNALARDAVNGIGKATAELRELAACVIPKSPKDQQIFPDGARNIFVGLGLYVLTAPEIPDEARNLSTIVALITPHANKKAMERIADIIDRIGPDHPAACYLVGAIGKGGGGTGMINNLTNYLVAYVDQEIAPMFAENEVDLDGLGEEPTVIFISSPSAAGNRAAVVNTIFSQSLSSLRACANRHQGKCPVRTILVMDEFASMNRCERLLRDLGEIRKENIGVILFWQSFNQLEAVAKYSREEAALVLDLCKSKVILSCGDIQIAKNLSEQMGTYTAQVTNRNQSKSYNGGSTGTADSIIRRALIDPSELTKWSPKNGMLVLHEGQVLALASKDVSETFVSGMLGMEDETRQYKAMEKHLVPRNLPQPVIWTEPTPDGTEGGLDLSVRGLDYEPEGF